MEITERGWWTLVHGMGFGTLYLMACSGALMELYRAFVPGPNEGPPGRERFFKFYLIAMAVLAWTTVLSGAYGIYPWYRAVPPAGQTDLALFPQRLLLSSASTRVWHSLGMEWKEHVAWLTPIATTMVAFVYARYGSQLRRHRSLRTAILGFAAAAFLAAGIAGFFGAMINKQAPVLGGKTITLSHGGEDGN